jgi:hypothetical protein
MKPSISIREIAKLDFLNRPNISYLQSLILRIKIQINATMYAHPPPPPPQQQDTDRSKVVGWKSVIA